MTSSGGNNYAFIDSQNLNVSIQKLGWKIDWRRFRRFLSDKYHVNKAFMFIGYVPEFESMYQQLHESGYLIVLKPTFDLTRPRPDADGPEAESVRQVAADDKKPIKGNVDADLVLWAMKELPSYQKAVIVSGDGDFYGLVEYLEQSGRLLKLLVPSGYYSSLFNRYEKYVERLDKYRRQLEYRPRRLRQSVAELGHG